MGAAGSDAWLTGMASLRPATDTAGRGMCATIPITTARHDAGAASGPDDVGMSADATAAPSRDEGLVEIDDELITPSPISIASDRSS